MHISKPWHLLSLIILLRQRRVQTLWIQNVLLRPEQHILGRLPIWKLVLHLWLMSGHLLLISIDSYRWFRAEEVVPVSRIACSSLCDVYSVSALSCGDSLGAYGALEFCSRHLWNDLYRELAIGDRLLFNMVFLWQRLLPTRLDKRLFLILRVLNHLLRLPLINTLGPRHLI